MRYLRGLLAVTLLFSLGWLLLAPEGSRPVRSQQPTPQISGAIRLPDGYTPPPLTLSPSAAGIQSTGLKAVAIVGDVGGSTGTYKNDMNHAVAVLQNHDVSVTTFYYGESSFSWSDIVAAATGAHFLLYMGHGVYWGSDCSHPTGVGGFYLGNGKFVSPDQIRDDLGGRIADESVVIFSHACFTAGNSGCDLAGAPTQAETERRVTMYAEPFSDIGMQAYFANNYFHSAESYVNQLLADSATRKNMGEIFKSVYPYQESQFKDLSYPTPTYDLWLSGSDGAWSDAFVGIPDHTFATDIMPQLGGLPDTLKFTYHTGKGQWLPSAATVTPANVRGDVLLHWSVSATGAGFTITPTSGTTPESFTIQATMALNATGLVTVTVTEPASTEGSLHIINVQLLVVDTPIYRAFLPCVMRHQ